MAALLLSKLVCTITTALQPEVESYYWTDSTSVLYWIQNNKAWKQYVGTRIKEIHRLTNKNHWMQCPGIFNSTDLPSQGLGAAQLVSCRMWWEGPAFLQLPADKWPRHEAAIEAEHVEREIVKKPPPIVSHVFTSVEIEAIPRNLQQIIDPECFSSLLRLLRVTALVMHFVAHLKKHHTSQVATYKLLNSH